MLDLDFDVPADSFLWDIPAMSPPDGVQSNFDNPTTLAGPIKVLNGLMPALAFIALGIRLYARAISTANQKAGWDDAFCVISMLGSITHTVLLYLSIESGYGRHLYDIRALSLTEEKLRIKTLNDEVYIITLLSIKISILIMYRRLFGIYKTSKRLINFGFVANIIVTFPYMGVAIARTIRCNGINALYIDLCLSRSVSTTVIVFAVFNTLLDFYVLLIPIDRVYQMKVAKKTKLGVIAIFMIGLVACAMSLVRLIITAIKFDDEDVFWTAASISPYTIVEMNLCIICTCMVFVPQVVRKIRGQKEPSPSAKSFGVSTESSGGPPTIGGGGYRPVNHSPAPSKNESKKSLHHQRDLQSLDSWDTPATDLNFLMNHDEGLTALPPPPRTHIV
ncbi:hypothetical protein BS50DRAFT_638754 [Corynespora cassiicola Philippines]|uniref:Rhodopsin domain-containing protein n=1 Tax=Corynespora cassiicola Philippines TaxID=1448308 RepID=A0A2T2N9R3_CORCC|nr:hypothetical protein BS50DRAFT_638754 [Corynespora cassiicola Philippines]